MFGQERAQAPASGRGQDAQVDRTVKDRLVIDPQDTEVKKLEPLIREVLERATNMLFHPEMLKRPPGAKTDPIDLLSTYNRDGLRIEVVSDVKAAWKNYEDKERKARGAGTEEKKSYEDPDYHKAAAFTYTETDPTTGLATGTVIVLDRRLFDTERAGGSTLLALPKVLAALCHELHHCRQACYPENGKKPEKISIATRERDAYEREQIDLDRVYYFVSRMRPVDYAAKFGILGPGMTRAFEGEGKVAEEGNFEVFSRVLKPEIERWRAREEKEKAASASQVKLPAGAITIDARGEGAKPVTFDPKYKDDPAYKGSLDTIRRALKDKTKIAAVNEGGILFRIEDKEGDVRDIILSRNFRSPEQQARALALGIEAMESMEKIRALMKKQGYSNPQIVLIEHTTGQPVRKIGIVVTTKSGQTTLYGSYNIKPIDEVQQIGEGRFESWETQVLKALESDTKK